MSDYRILRNLVIEEDCSGLADTIEIEVLDALRSNLPQSRNENFVLSVKDDQSKLVGGVSASMSYGWLLIKTLWIDVEYRSQGIGAALLESAEQKGVAMGCHAAWLDTSSPEAMQFYEKLGYRVFGSLGNEPGQFPETHQRWFMRKTLGD